MLFEPLNGPLNPVLMGVDSRSTGASPVGVFLLAGVQSFILGIRLCPTTRLAWFEMGELIFNKVPTSVQSSREEGCVLLLRFCPKLVDSKNIYQYLQGH